MKNIFAATQTYLLAICQPKGRAKHIQVDLVETKALDRELFTLKSRTRTDSALSLSLSNR